MCFEKLINILLGKHCHYCGEENNMHHRTCTQKPIIITRKTASPSRSSISEYSSKESRRLSAKIDRKLQADRILSEMEIKLLLLGTGESGKSTLMKQMKVIHNNGYHMSELLAFRKDIHRNLVESIQQLLASLSNLSIDICDLDRLDVPPPSYSRKYSIEEKNALQNAVSLILRVQAPTSERVGIGVDGGTPPPTSVLSAANGRNWDLIDESIADAIKLLWRTTGLRKHFDKLAHSSYILCQAPYFLDNVERIGMPGYIPSVQDVLRARIKTTGISETRFKIRSGHYSPSVCMIDVGGQISERKKWIHCFESVTAILFCVSLSEYDQVLLEDASQSRLLDSLLLFESIVNSQWFKNTTIILFLNKIDLFKSKLAISPLSYYFEDYDGPPNDFEHAASFIQSKFLSLNYSGLPIYTHFTCATDTRQIETVFAAIKETILSRALKETGLL